MLDSVAHDVGDVVIGDAVDHGMTRPLGMDQPAQTQDAQVLGHEGLRGSGASLELRDAERSLGELGEHDDPQGVTEGAEEVRRECRRLIRIHAPSQTGICRYSNPRILGALSTA